MSGFDLPAGLPVLIGREREIDDVTRLVKRRRMVTLTGPSGIGKTRIAIEVARRVQRGRSSRAAMVELAPIGDFHLVAQSVASALGLEFEPGRDPVDTVVADLAARPTLLVLDNCEHLVAACAELIDRLLRESEQTSVLATSQRPLGVDGEELCPVPALSVPEAASTSEDALASSAAVALFFARATAINRDFVLSDDTLPAVVEICRRLEGIPLAIELAAARTAVMGPADIAERLDQRLGLLTKGSRRSPPRHQTLRAAIDWSYDLLGDQEATLLRRLSVFAGGACTAAIGDVVSGDTVARADVGSLVESLVARSLVTAAAGTSSAPSRYRLLETVRAYARERLDEAGESDTVCSRHARWCTARAEQLSALDDTDPEWVSDLEIDHDNLRAALTWALHADPSLGLRLAVALIAFWQERGYFAEGQRWLSRALGAAGAAGPGVVVPAVIRAEALWGIALLATVRGDVGTARPAVEEALRLARKANLPSAEAKAASLLGFILIFAQEALTAKPVLEDAVRRARASGDERALAGSLSMLGRAHLFLGEIDEARRAFEECVGLSGAHPGVALFGLARAGLASGHDELAEEQCKVALPMLRKGAERFQVALALGILGELAWARGDLGRARELAEDGLDEARAMGAPYPTAQGLCVLARVAAAEGNLASARRLAEQACEVAATHLAYARVRCLHVRGWLKMTAGEVDGARRDYEDALATAANNGDRQGRAASLRHLAGLLRARGDEGDAAGLLVQAIGAEAEIGGGGLASALEALAAVEVDKGQADHGASLYGAAQAIRQSGGPLRRPDEVLAYDADIAALRAVLKGRTLQSAWTRGAKLSAEEAAALAVEGAPRRAPTSDDRWAKLTSSERRVAEMVVNGLSSRQIGKTLGISERTVQGHVGRALAKLDLTSRRDLKDLGTTEPARNEKP